MANLLDHSFPDIGCVDVGAISPITGKPQFLETLQRIVRDIEIALSKIEFPSEVEGKDESRALTWFIN